MAFDEVITTIAICTGDGDVHHNSLMLLCQVEKHIRKNKLKLTFTDQLGKAVTLSQDEESEISSKKEAKKLAFYLFWNVRPTLSR